MSAISTDIATVKHYTDTSKSAQAQRIGEFLLSAHPIDKDGRTVGMRLLKSSWEGLIGGTVAGGILGAAVGFPFGASIPCAKVGAAIGAPIGAGLGARQEIIYFKEARIYETWLAQARATNIYPIFQKYLADNHLEEFFCSTTSSLIITPMRDPHGCIIEGDSLKKAFDNAQTIDGVKKLRCILAKDKDQPLDRHGAVIPYLTEQNFEYDLDYHNRLMTAILPLFASASANPEILEGLKAVRAQIVTTRKNAIHASIDKIIEDGVNGDMKEDEVAAKVAAVVKKLKIA